NMGFGGGGFGGGGPGGGRGAGGAGTGGRGAAGGPPAGFGQQGAFPGGSPGGQNTGGQNAGGFGGPGGGVGTSVVAYLKAHQGGAKYAVAVADAQTAGPYIMAGLSVLPMGGFSGQVPFPTVAQFQSLVSNGQVRYVLAGGRGGRGGPGGAQTGST